VVTAHGGGVGGQSGAVRMDCRGAISRFNPELRPRAAQERIFDARFAHEGTQEVRTEGRAQALPVHEALIFCGSPT